ncbi:MAG: chitobiase/beta-hexosaminidase C-terminal domain-containing protein [Lachnospiraceae bacterium]|nr:chitobiase/beta-hexosaminidase C-terminal domain-containing protein [Lachnospiraceae bacterium]
MAKKYLKSILSLIIVAGLILMSPATEALAYNESVNNDVEDSAFSDYDAAPYIVMIPVDTSKEPYVGNPKAVDVTDIGDSDSSVINSNNLGSAIYNNDWDKYSSNLYYNQLSDEKKQIWDEINNLAFSYLAGYNAGIDFEEYGGNYVLGKIDCEPNGTPVFTSTEDLQQFIFMYWGSNPQYYFLSANLRFNDDFSAIYPGVYEDFASASVRSVATSNFETRLAGWVSEAGEATSESEKMSKLLTAHQRICEEVEYNHEVISSTGDGGEAITEEEDQKYHTQSAYSAVVEGVAVCAGYAEALTCVCNAINIDADCMTSDTHEWNNVRINNSFYNVDCTWADLGAGYKYFMKSNSDYAVDKATNVKSHTPRTIYGDLMPECTLTTGSTQSEVGTLPSPVGTVATPVCDVTKNGNTYDITITDDTSGAKIYYTTDGSIPSPVFTKCNVYTGEFNVSDYSKVKAMAIKDTYLDSSVVTAKMEGEDTSDNVISVDTAKGIAYVKDGVTGTAAAVPLEYITEGKVYRMYDSRRGEHFYTKNSGEAASLMAIGWDHEENADFTVASAYNVDAIPVYRLYNENNGGMHFYTENAAEARLISGQGWIYEGISHYVYNKTSTKGSPQYRLYNPGSSNGEHNWTADMGEYNMLVGLGWKDEGLCWRVL